LRSPPLVEDVARERDERRGYRADHGDYLGRAHGAPSLRARQLRASERQFPAVSGGLQRCDELTARATREAPKPLLVVGFRLY
jgi:hypothetical protein